MENIVPVCLALRAVIAKGPLAVFVSVVARWLLLFITFQSFKMVWHSGDCAVQVSLKSDDGFIWIFRVFPIILKDLFSELEVTHFWVISCIAKIKGTSLTFIHFFGLVSSLTNKTFPSWSWRKSESALSGLKIHFRGLRRVYFQRKTSHIGSQVKAIRHLGTVNLQRRRNRRALLWLFFTCR